MSSTFTISLDFELHWGGFEKWPLENYREYFLNTRKVIPEMLNLFEQYHIHVTWAGVGMLFHSNREALMKNAPHLRPSYADKELSAYDYIKNNGVGETEEDDPFHFAASLVKQIVDIPLGGSHGSMWKKLRNTFIVFLLSGFWHGANWTFIIWGLINALCFLPLLLSAKNRMYTDTVAEGKLLPSAKEMTQIVITFLITVFAWIFFRADSVTTALEYLQGMLNESLFTMPQVRPMSTVALMLFLMIIEWMQRDKQHALQLDTTRIPKIARWGLYYCIIVITILFGGSQQEFIYFQF